ncbi:LacI family DNA-binding transcriptional regulator [Phyllobacterium sp. P30BS-XVII]|uniref:LacI family DNA-binding transcriptional regulator n=1 Tax=Phyllobacterium sp. P30BS-XVII TaxID=2587046 RepID=UPI000DDE266B|nr:LacI family DNA-binding transcriptional regulator [Phyllobacterium sp. P30BS-XVII]MBA8903164.1 DNA-binding LacI/PurR family transcriptional regulator [Phyllobacterium sp. P30BS-XVII]
MINRHEIRKPTIKDVARESGVSIATVTRVLQKSPKVSEETKRKIESAIKHLNYRPDLLARALVMRESRILGLIVPSSSDQYWGEIAAGVEARAREFGYQILLGNTGRDPDKERELAEHFLSHKVKGLIVGGASQASRAWLHDLGPAIKTVLVGWDAKTIDDRHVLPALVEDLKSLSRSSPDLDSSDMEAEILLTDDHAAAGRMAAYLVELGHKEIVFLAGRLLRPAALMLEGIQSELQRIGAWPCPVWRSDETFEAGRTAARQILEQSSRPTAIFAYNDVLAIGAMRGAREAGLSIPKDITIVGFDDIEAARFVEPPLTTVRSPKRMFGARAVDYLLTAEPDVKGTSTEFELVIRSSSSCPSR